MRQSATFYTLLSELYISTDFIRVVYQDQTFKSFYNQTSCCNNRQALSIAYIETYVRGHYQFCSWKAESVFLTLSPLLPMRSSLRRPYSCTGRTFKESPGAISPLRENPRLTQAGRNLWRPPSPLPSPLTHDHHVQVAFEHLQGQRLCHVSLLAQRTVKKGNVM